MTIEQRPELNRFVDPSIPLTWQWRRQQLKLLLPLWIFMCVLLLEQATYKAWLANRLNSDVYGAVFAVCFFILLVILAGGEIGVRVQHRSRRKIKFTDKNIHTKPAGRNFIPWKRIAKFQFEPIADAPEYTKLSFFLQPPSARKIPNGPYWKMALTGRQKQDLLGFLQSKKTEGIGTYDIEILERTIQVTHPPRSMPGFMFSLLGLLLLFHGVPLLLAGLSLGHDSGGHSKLTLEQADKLRQFIHQHFASREEYQHFLLATGTGLTIMGTALIIAGRRLMNSKMPAAPGERDQ